MQSRSLVSNSELAAVTDCRGERRVQLQSTNNKSVSMAAGQLSGSLLTATSGLISTRAVVGCLVLRLWCPLIPLGGGSSACMDVQTALLLGMLFHSTAASLMELVYFRGFDSWLRSLPITVAWYLDVFPCMLCCRLQRLPAYKVPSALLHHLVKSALESGSLKQRNQPQRRSQQQQQQTKLLALKSEEVLSWMMMMTSTKHSLYAVSHLHN